MISENRAHWRSFAGGELSEEMYGRVDLPRHNIGLKRCYNTNVTPQGALENRAGSRFIAETNTGSPAWLIPFVRSDGQGFLVEIGDSYIRVLGGGNIVNEETAPVDTITVTAVDVWTSPDPTPITPVLFTTSAPHGLVAGNAIRFQGFSLVNSDQAGANTLASYMNVTWYVATVPSSTTFTISTVQTPPIAYALLDAGNLSFEQGDTGWIKSAAIGDAIAVIENLAPTNDGSWRARLQDPTPGSDKVQSVECSTYFPTTPGKSVTVTCRAYCFSDHDETRAQLSIMWYNASNVFISASHLTPTSTANGAEIMDEATWPERGGLIGTTVAFNKWTTLSTTGIAPAGAASYRVRFRAGFYQEGGWYADTFTVGSDARSTWIAFSPAPYNGLVTPGTVALTSNTTAITLSPTYTQAHIRFAEYAQFVDDLIIAHKLYPTAKLTRVSDNEWTFTALAFNQALAAPSNIAVTPQGTPGTPAITYRYTVTAVNDDGAESAPGTEDTADNTLRTLGNFNDITFDPVTGAFRYNVYKGIGGGAVYGFIGSMNSNTEFTDDNISPDFTKQPPAVLATFASGGQYPGTVAFHEQRMILGATVTEPQAFWASGLAAFDYFKASVPPQDDQAFTYELASQKAAPILHSLAGDELLFFTSAGVQRVIAVDGELFGPVTVAARKASAFGAHELAKPQEAGSNILYPVERGAHLYELKPSDALSGYEANDLSVIAAHLIDGKDWVQTAMRRAPYPIWYGLRDDGIIVGLTYMPEQQVYAWHQHELPGAFIESIAVVPEGKVDSLYVIARRTISGNTVRYIERIEKRNFGTDQAEAYFVDCGITYRGAQTDVVGGLDHLEGENVMVLADGRVLGPYEVFGGEITIDEIASVIHVGLPYTSEIETLPLAFAQQQGFGVGIMKNISAIWLRLKKAFGITAGVSFSADDQRPLVDDAEEQLGDVPALRNGVHDITPVGVWTQDSTICVQQTQPLPFTLTGLAVDYTEG